MLFNLKKVIEQPRDLQEDLVLNIGTNIDIKYKLSGLFPKVVWEDEYCTGFVPDYFEGRLEFILDEGDSTKILNVLTSQGIDSTDTVKLIAKWLGNLYVLDLQTNEFI